LKALVVVLAVLGLAGSASPAPGIVVPAGFRVSVVARGLTHPTAMAWGPRGRIFVTEDNGRLVELRGGSPHRIASGLRTPLGLAFSGSTAFVSETGRIERLVLRGGKVASRRVLVGRLPYGEHQQDNVVVGPDHRLYFGSGSTCDACPQRDRRSAAILSMPLGGGKLRVVATGLRNPYGLAFQPKTGRLYASVNGRDTLGANEPAEMVVRVRYGARYGWPACWPSWRQRRLVGSCAGVAKPSAYLEPHSSADGIAFWRGGLYVAEWGQYLSNRRGRRVVRIQLGPSGAKSVTTFADGLDHPLALLPSKRALLVADWGRGLVYRIAPS
jgi:glucose/arabinose dehydrogenase